jgi:hypothetical protein
MLALPKRFPGQVVAACDECRTDVRIEARSLDDARTKLASLSWLERARKGAGPKGAHWNCPKCNPTLKPRSGSMGRST